MNSALILLNAIALAVVVAFHFQPGSSADPLASAPVRYTQYQSPQRLVMSDRAVDSARIASDIQVEQPTGQQSESWVF